MEKRGQLDVAAIQREQREFVRERDWERFHTPKNLVMALAGEVGELIEHFQWLTPEESAQLKDEPEAARAVADEMADVLVYLLRLADLLDIDLQQAVTDKVRKNRAKYPVEQARGRARKYYGDTDSDGDGPT